MSFKKRLVRADAQVCPYKSVENVGANLRVRPLPRLRRQVFIRLKRSVAFTPPMADTCPTTAPSLDRDGTGGAGFHPP
jgi:hypothetical protein